MAPSMVSQGGTVSLTRIATVVGIGIIVAGTAARATRSWRGEPGKLVAIHPEIIWEATPIEPGKGGGASATFEVTNVGGRPVKIIATESGCATPTVERSLVAPGEKTKIEVMALAFPIGERRTQVLLHTDSPITPRVPLQLRMIGSQRPPFLLGIRGDLAFVGEPELGAGRELVVTTVEKEGGEDDRRPMLRSDLQVLFEPKGVESSPYAIPGAILKTYKYEMWFNEKPKSGTFSGEVRAIDPWITGHAETLRVYGVADPDLRAMPSSLVLTYGRKDRLIEPARLIVLTKGSAAESCAEPKDRDKSPILVERGEVGASNRVCEYFVKLNPRATLQPGRFEIIVKETPRSTRQLVVPVSVRESGDR